MSVEAALDTATESAVKSAKADFLEAKGQLSRSLETTCDERLNWSPSVTSRTPLAVFAHAADSVKHIHGTLDGRTFPVPTTAEAERGFREFERAFTTREQVLSLLEENGAAYLAWLDTLTSERLASHVTMPYNLGKVPMTIALTFVGMHTRWHAAQIDYIQTVYGDHDWHIGA